MPRGRKKKVNYLPKVKPEVLRSLLAILVIFFSLLSLVSFILPDYTINAVIKEFWFSKFGYASVLIPIALISFGLLLIPSVKAKIKEPAVLGGIFILIVTVTGFLHIFIDSENASEVASQGKGGGLVGYKISMFLLTTVSIYGGILILLFLLGVAIILIFEISLDQMFGIFSDKLSALGSFIKSIFKKETEKESEVEVTTGGFTDKSDKQAVAEQAPAKEEIPIKEPVIEIIPSPTEPQSHTAVRPSTRSDTQGNIVAAPIIGPGRDRIWQFPPLDLLQDYADAVVDSGDIEYRAKKIKEVLKSFDINVEIQDTKVGPSVTQYQLKSEFGTRVAQISSLQNDIAMAISSPNGTVRIEAPIPGKNLIGVEVPNSTRATVSFKSLITADSMKAMKSKLGTVLGKDVGGRALAADIAKMPHMLVAGTTGSGKSIFIHNLLFSILYRATPHEVKFILVDPKRVELINYQDMPHLITPVVTDMEKAPAVFKWATIEMERRYKLLEKARVPNIDAYNEQSGFQAMPYIVIVVDELAEIMVLDQTNVEKSIIRLAQLARAVGIHLILAVQRPSTNIITGAIKANIPCRIAFNVASQVDSRVIIDQQGAEKLLGKGDMLFVPPDISKPIRLQGGFVSTDEVKKLVAFLRDQGVPPLYDEGISQMSEKTQMATYGSGNDTDQLFDEAMDIVILAKKASASLLQRKLSIGYARAARIMDELESKGIIAPSDGTSKPREVLIDDLPAQGESVANESQNSELDDSVEQL